MGLGWGMLSKQREQCVCEDQSPGRAGHQASEAVGSGSIAGLRGFKGAVI